MKYLSKQCQTVNFDLFFSAQYNWNREDWIVNPTEHISNGENSRIPVPFMLSGWWISLYYTWVICQMMSFDSDSRKNGRNLKQWKSWRSCYFWPFDISKGRLITREHQSVKINFTCSLPIWWNTIWGLKTCHDSVQVDKVVLCPISWHLSLCFRFLCFNLLAQVSS